MTAIEVPFKDPKPKQVDAAVSFIRTMRIREVKPEYQPEGHSRGPLLSAHGAAVKFAACFGVNMPAKRSDAKRPRKK